MLRLHRIVLATCLSFGVGASVLATPVDAAGTATTLTSKYTVVNGDYLAGIALKLNVTLKDLLVANRLTVSSLILPGMQLAVPATVRATTPAATKPVPNTVGAKPAAYTVVNGDYLTGIAQKLGVTTRGLLKANGLTLNSLIWPGMQLKVPAGGVLPSSAAPAAPAAPASSTSPAASGATYTVVTGDYLAGIAQKLGVKLGSLLTVNQMTTSSLIRPGLLLKVPAGGTVPAASNTGNSGNSGNTGTPVAAAVSPNVNTVITYARAQLGKPYRFNTAGPATFDCSGLTLAAFATIGVTLPHYSGAQMSFGTIIDWTTEAIRPGDLIFFESAPGTGVVNHVGIATSANTWIQAPRSGDVVREGKFTTVRIIGVRRLVNG